MQERKAVNCAVWTPEGRRCVTGSNSGEFILWNGQSFRFETTLQVPPPQNQPPHTSFRWNLFHLTFFCGRDRRIIFHPPQPQSRVLPKEAGQLLHTGNSLAMLSAEFTMSTEDAGQICKREVQARFAGQKLCTKDPLATWAECREKMQARRCLLQTPRPRMQK